MKNEKNTSKSTNKIEIIIGQIISPVKLAIKIVFVVLLLYLFLDKVFTHRKRFIDWSINILFISFSLSTNIYIY